MTTHMDIHRMYINFFLDTNGSFEFHDLLQVPFVIGDICGLLPLSEVRRYQCADT